LVEQGGTVVKTAGDLETKTEKKSKKGGTGHQRDGIEGLHPKLGGEKGPSDRQTEYMLREEAKSRKKKVAP